MGNEFAHVYEKRIGPLQQAYIPYIQYYPPKVDLPYKGPGRENILKNFRPDLIVASTKKHALVKLKAPGSHHPDGSEVLWVAEIDREGNFQQWSENSWQRMADDPEIVFALQEKMIEASKSGQTTYLYFGCLENKQINEQVHLKDALASVDVPHDHLVNPIDSEKYRDSTINLMELGPGNQDEARRINLFANMAGEVALLYWKHIIEDFSNNKIEFKQKLQAIDGGSVFYDRTFFGFPSLLDAVNQILELQKHITSDGWLKFCHEIIQGAPTMQIDEYLINFFKQSAVINCFFTIPSQADKIQGGVQNDDSLVWAAPFSTATVLQAIKGQEIKRLYKPTGLVA